jgi:hypothetical protein
VTAKHIMLFGSEEVIRQLSEIDFGEGIKVGRSQPADGFANAADGPLGPEEIRQIVELVSVIITTSSAALVFFEKLRNLIKPGQPVTVKDAKTGEKLVTMDETTDAAAVAAKVGTVEPK